MISTHFSADEFACKCGEEHPLVYDQSFIDKLEKTREFYGKKMVINSGHRCKYWNEKQGGVESSKHLTGEAADIQCTGERSRGEIVSAAIQAGIKRIGIAKTFVHLDGGAADKVTIWLY